MEKIGIYLCREVSERCTANGCIRTFNETSDSFERYKDTEHMLSSIGMCNGCDNEPVDSIDIKIEKMLKAGITSVHLSTCIRGRCDHYQVFADKLSQHFDVVGYTHGSKTGKKDNTINMIK